MVKKVNIPAAFAQLDGPFSPRIAGDINDTQVKIAIVNGAFDWHSHADEDEAFYIIKGEMDMEFRDHTVRLEQGDFLVVPRGVEHRPVSKADCHIMMVELATVVNTGDAETTKTKTDLEYLK